MSAMQCYLRAEGTDDWAGEKAHVYGSSTCHDAKFTCQGEFVARLVTLGK